MQIYGIYRAQVISNDDSAFDGKKLSRVQLKLYPIMQDVQDTSLLPWAEPLEHDNGISTDTGSHKIPEKDSWVFAYLLDPYLQTIRYGRGFYIEGFSKAESWANDFNSLIQNSDIGSQTYPQPMNLEVFKDGSCQFRNTQTGEMGFIHNKGTYTIFDKDGNIKSYLKDKSSKIYNDKTSIIIANGDSTDKGKITVNVNNKINATFDGNDTDVKVDIILDNTVKFNLENSASSKKIIADANGSKITLDGSTLKTFKLEDGTNTIESGASGLNLNNHVSITP